MMKLTSSILQVIQTDDEYLVSLVRTTALAAIDHFVTEPAAEDGSTAVQLQAAREGRSCTAGCHYRPAAEQRVLAGPGAGAGATGVQCKACRDELEKCAKYLCGQDCKDLAVAGLACSRAATVHTCQHAAQHLHQSVWQRLAA